MPQKYFIKLCHCIGGVWKFIITDIDGSNFFRKRANTFHVFPHCAESGPSEDIFSLIDQKAIFFWWHAMIIFAVDSIGAASSGKEQTEIGSIFFIEKISCCITDI